MIGIYQDNFVDYLKKNLGENIKVSSKNIIMPCPWCEYPSDKDHYHMYVSLEAPIFHCFHATCERGGNLRKLMRKIAGHDISDTFVDKVAAAEARKRAEVFEDKTMEKVNVKIPPLNKKRFSSYSTVQNPVKKPLAKAAGWGSTS